MKLAREFGRPDWRAMLAGMSSTELGDWAVFYQQHYFHDAQLDAHFSGLTYAVFALFSRDSQLSPGTFSLFNPTETVTEQEDPDDDMLMAKAEGISGGIRYDPVNGRAGR
ncbi:phage tail assembly protein T [Entomohabitans teleogrylli]|uniref:phage tail assembly protein T n=1 Tax=Entomohabitans teleogrylli TaxID=1384589 RepID=UPI00073D2372|nr:phage tail assembly protein T [Entomohabitans teleogrylli]